MEKLTKTKSKSLIKQTDATVSAVSYYYLSKERVTVSFSSGMSSPLTVMSIVVSLCPDKNTTEPLKGPASSMVTAFELKPEGFKLQ